MISVTDQQFLARVASHAATAMPAAPDPAHDLLHVQRVAALAETIARAEAADLVVSVAAAQLHELVTLPKDHPESARAGDLCADAAATWLASIGTAPPRIHAICDCIRDHAFSKGAAPRSLEAQVLQDADRLDAIGAIGIARLFATCTSMRRPFYCPTDPLCRTREPDDRSFGVDHFFRKLLRIADGLHTATARRLAGPRVAIMDTYLAALAAELPAVPRPVVGE